jgi:hypothetical protein
VRRWHHASWRALKAAQEHVTGLVLIWLAMMAPVIYWLLRRPKWPSLS